MSKLSDTELPDFINQCKIRLQKILDRLEWSEEATLKDFNTNSVACSLQKELKKTNSPKIATYPDTCDTQNSIVLESPKLQSILQNNKVQAPRNFKELQENFSREQKLKIYEYVIENTKKLENHSMDEEVAKGEISLGDILAQKKREDKRKKRRFRKSKPTHIEEVRCLVDLQMQALQQFINNKLKKDQHYLCNSQSIEKEGLRRNDNSKGKRKYYGEYYKAEQKTYTFKEHYVKADRLERYSRSPSREYVRHQNKRYKTSSSKDLSYAKSKHSERFNEEKRRSKTNTKEKHRQSRSKERHSQDSANKRHSNHSYNRHSRSHNKGKSKERHKSRSRSCERYTRNEDNEYSRKYWNRREIDASNEDCNEKYYKNENECWETSSSKHRSIREDTSNMYDDENHRRLHQSQSYEKNKNVSNRKSSKRKKRKHKRDRS